MITLGDYLLVSGILFSIGFAGVMLRRNLIIILMSLELMLNAANLSLVAFSRFRLDPNGLPNYNAQVFVFFIITVAAAEVAVGLAILVALFRARQTTDVKDISSLNPSIKNVEQFDLNRRGARKFCLQLFDLCAAHHRRG